MKLTQVISTPVAALALLLLTDGASASLYMGNNGNQSATANFQFTGTSSLALTLNDLTTIHSIADILDGFSWQFADTSFTMHLDSIFVSGGRETCTTSVGPPPHITTCTHDANTNGSGTWGVFVVDGQVDMFSFGQQIHPYGIVNSSFVSNASQAGGLTNGQHNPVLLGPVTFNFSFAGLDSTDLRDVDFLFGTQPIPISGTCTSDCRPVPRCTSDCGGEPSGSVPEPATVALLGIGLAGILARRRDQHRGRHRAAGK